MVTDLGRLPGGGDWYPPEAHRERLGPAGFNIWGGSKKLQEVKPSCRKEVSGSLLLKGLSVWFCLVSFLLYFLVTTGEEALLFSALPSMVIPFNTGPETTESTVPKPGARINPSAFCAIAQVFVTAAKG